MKTDFLIFLALYYLWVKSFSPNDFYLILQEDKIPKGVYQWCGSEALTKYDMIKIMANQFSLERTHIKAAKGPSPGAKRPYDTTMDTSRLSQLSIQYHTPFAKGIKSCLEKWK